MSDWNPYWDEVKDHVRFDELLEQHAVLPPHPDPPENTDSDLWSRVASSTWRQDIVPRYAWTIPDPDTIAFVTGHTGPSVIDPMAGTGYWARLLADRGITVAAFDRNPPGGAKKNDWHPGARTWAPVQRGKARQTVAAAGPEQVLLLSWPPFNTPDGAQALGAYTGDRLIYIGDAACCGDDDLCKILATEWTLVEIHQPVQWWGMHDNVYILDRKPTSPR